MKKLVFAFALVSALSAPAHALFEIRAGYGLYTPDEDLGLAATLGTVQGFNIDALVEIPLVPVGLGLRYETMDFAFGLSGTDFDSSFNRLSIIANYRFIDLFFYLGAIGTLGVINEANLEGIPVGSVNRDIKWTNDVTMTAGVEGGVSLGLFQVGAELGYMIGGDYEIETESVVFGGDPLNFDGIYAKVLVGVGF